MSGSLARPSGRGGLPRRLLVVLGGLLAALLLAEGLWRALAEGPEAPGKRFHRSVSQPDADLLYRLRPGVRGNWRLANANETADAFYTINAAGRRGPDFDGGGDGEPLLVATLGDSCTLGYGVADGETYAHRLGTLLAGRLPQRRVRVLNFGVHGYTSREGLAQLVRDVLPLRPDVVVLAFGFNDASVQPTRLDDAYAVLPPRAWMPVHTLLDRHSALYRALWEATHPIALLPALQPRLDRERYADNVAAMVAAAREAGARPVLLDLTLPTAFLRATLAETAARLDVELLPALGMFEEEAAARGDLALPLLLRGDDSGAVTLRVRAAAPPLLLWVDLADGRRAVQPLPMRDDGEQGDEVAGDGVFTLRAPLLPRDVSLEISFTSARRLAAHVQAGNHCLYRRLELSAGKGFHGGIWDEQVWHAGLDRFLRVAARDVAHPTAEGHRMLAEALADVLAPAFAPR